MPENLPWCHGLVREVTVKEILVVVTAWRILLYWIFQPVILFISLQNPAIGLVACIYGAWRGCMFCILRNDVRMKISMRFNYAET